MNLTVFKLKIALAVAGVGMMNAPRLDAQAAAPKFEVASIRLCEGGDSGAKGGARGGGGPGSQGPSPDRLTMNCQPLRSYIRSAYVTFADGRRMAPGTMTPIEGGPGWVDSERYQITAKAEGTPGQEMMRGPMLQALLEDRFKLKVRRENREVPAYALTVAKNGPKLQAFRERLPGAGVLEAAGAAPSRPEANSFLCVPHASRPQTGRADDLGSSRGHA